MLARCLFAAASLIGCAAPATLPAARVSALPAATTTPGTPVEAHRAHRLARLAPPFAAAGGTRHVMGGEAATALVTPE
jgi:hypothetical protein